MNTESKPNKVTLSYINLDAPRVAAPEYPGEYYDARVPATLDLAERARLCVNALTECQLTDTGWLSDGHPERVDR